ncbi:hypothetical protein V6R21_13355 [Limibacter armeniacum]|uniref:hypothetical protein n=1 Tax=Limibacter armeniacum TaxID=466084 RepID=UPI002FE56387
MKISTTFFNKLPYEQKVETIYLHAEMVSELNYHGRRYELYCIQGTFIEVVVNKDNQRIADIRVLENTDRLAHYCESVNLSTLL